MLRVEDVVVATHVVQCHIGRRLDLPAVAVRILDDEALEGGVL